MPYGISILDKEWECVRGRLNDRFPRPYLWKNCNSEEIYRELVGDVNHLTGEKIDLVKHASKNVKKGFEGYRTLRSFLPGTILIFGGVATPNEPDAEKLRIHLYFQGLYEMNPIYSSRFLIADNRIRAVMTGFEEGVARALVGLPQDKGEEFLMSQLDVYSPVEKPLDLLQADLEFLEFPNSEKIIKAVDEATKELSRMRTVRKNSDGSWSGVGLKQFLV